MSNATVTGGVKAVTSTVKAMTPALAWINPMLRMRDGSTVKGCYNMRIEQDLTLKAGDTLFVAQVKDSGSYVVKTHQPRTAAPIKA